MISAEELRTKPTKMERLIAEQVNDYLVDIERHILDAHDEGETSVTVRIYQYCPGDEAGEIGNRVLKEITELGYHILEIKPDTGYWNGTALARISWSDDLSLPEDDGDETIPPGLLLKKSIDDWVVELSNMAHTCALGRYTADISGISECELSEIRYRLLDRGYGTSTKGLPEGQLDVIDTDR